MRNVRCRRPVYRFRRDKPTDDQPLGDFKGLIMDEKRPECRFRRNKLTDIGNTASGGTQSEIKSGLLTELRGAGRTKSEVREDALLAGIRSRIYPFRNALRYAFGVWPVSFLNCLWK